MPWFSQAPSNIALIKYMGKKETPSDTPLLHNQPDNPSLSYTLPHLQTNVMLEIQPGEHDFWEPLPIPGAAPFELKKADQLRFLKHLAFLKDCFNYTGGFIVRSSNNFPLGCGLASSASSFAALTKCAVIALSELTQKAPPTNEEQAKLSRIGSGSSCRSFFSPWALWKEEGVGPIDIPYANLIHEVILVSHTEKKVSSSEAHQRIKTSHLYPTRPQRARDNLKLLLQGFAVQNWEEIFLTCWHEFQDIHTLFATSQKPFHYITEDSQKVLNLIQDFWHKQGDGPLVTMDAGPNVHLLYREDQDTLAQQFKADHLVGNYDVL